MKKSGIFTNAKRKLAGARAAAVMMIGVSVFGITSCGQVIAPIEREMDYPDLGSDGFIIENHSDVPDAELADKIVAILAVCRDIEQNNPYMRAFMARVGTRVIFDNLPASSVETVFAWVYDAAGNPNIYINARHKGEFNAIRLKNVMLHEITHRIQQDNGYGKSMISGMRPDVVVALKSAMEFFAYFYGDGLGLLMPASLENGAAMNSKIMAACVDISSAEPGSPERSAANNLPWMQSSDKSALYTNKHINEVLKAGIKGMAPSDRVAVMKCMRLLADSRDPSIAPVSDEALEFAYDKIHALGVGESPYVRFGDTTDEMFLNDIEQKKLDDLLALCAEWDAKAASGRAGQIAANQKSRGITK
jgi:hypothetical protein